MGHCEVRMTDEELKACLARLEADPTPCRCLICWMRTVPLGPEPIKADKPLITQKRLTKKKRSDKVEP